MLGTPVSVGSIATACAQRPRQRLERRLDHVVNVASRPRSSGAASAWRWRPARGGTPRSARGRSSRSPRAAARLERRAARAPRCRSRTPRAPRPSAPSRGRSGRSRRGRRAPGRAPGRCRSRRPRPCGARRSAGRRSPARRGRAAPWRASRSSMWSRKPTPVVALPGAGAVERERDADLGLAGLTVDLGGSRLIARAILADARLHRAGVELEALGAGDRRRRPRERGAVGDPHLGEAAAEVRRCQRRGEPRRRRWSAGCGWSRRCSRRTRCRRRRRRTGSRRA